MYTDLEGAKEYLTERYSSMPEDAKLNNALYRAYDKIESIDVRWSGEKANFPREIEKIVPYKVIQAQIEEAYAMSYKTELESNSNVKSKSNGDMSVTFLETTLQGVQFYSRIAYSIMKKYKRKTYG